MLALLLLTAALAAASALLGQGLAALCGWRTWQWWAPAVGYALMLIVGGQLVKLQRDFWPVTLTLFLIACSLASLVLPSVRSALRQAGPELLLIGVSMTLLAAIPFFAAGHTGVLGATVSNDMSQHLTAAYYLRTGDSMLPQAAIGGNLISTGYPLGPHGLTAMLTALTGVGEETTFSAVTIVVPALTAFAALAFLPGARRAPRWATAAVVGLGYLPAAYLAQGSFKEISQALILLATAAVLAAIAREQTAAGWRRGIPIGVLAGGAIYNYSYGGGFWSVAAFGVMLLFEAIRRRHALRAMVRHWVAPVAGALLGLAVTVAPEVSRIEKFTHSIFGTEPKENRGNLFHAINPLEAVGVWQSGDFRLNPHPMWPSVALTVLALVVLAGALVWWWRRGEPALPAAVVAGLVIWADLAITRNIYNAAKGLVVLAPVLMACIAVPLAFAWSARPVSARRRGGLVAVRAASVVLLIAAVLASGAVLRAAPVGLGSRADELNSLRPLLHRKDVLFLTNDHFLQWELRGANTLYGSGLLYVPARLGEHPQKEGGQPVDADNYGSPDLDKVRYIVTQRSDYQSEIPPNFRLVRETPSFRVYHRRGRTPLREPLEPPGTPGTVADCGSARAKKYLSLYHWAGVLPRPVVSAGWKGSIATPGSTARLRLTLPRGRWDLSLQYVSTTRLTVSAPGLRRRLPPNFGVIVAYWPAGTLTSDGRPLTVTLKSDQRSWFGRLLGKPRATLAYGRPDYVPLWHAAFTRHGAKVERIPSSQACGRYADWFAPSGSHMTGR